MKEEEGGGLGEGGETLGRWFPLPPPHEQRANEHVYAVLSARGHLYADLAQDDADAILALHLADAPAPLETPDAAGAMLPPNHPIAQLVRDAAWLVRHPACAA